MAQVPINKRLLAEDFPPEQKSWIIRLLIPLNDFMTQVTGAFNNGITVRENMLAEHREVEFIVRATADLTFPLKFKTKFALKPLVVTVVGAKEVSGAPQPIGQAVFADWTYENGQISITNLTGLTIGTTYKVMFHVSYG